MLKEFLNKQSDILAQIDPDRIYVENIRSFFHLPNKVAKFLLDLAVREDLLRKRYGVYCPNCGRLIKSYDSLEEIDSIITCDICHSLEQKHIFSKSEIEIQEFYQLINGKLQQEAS